MLNVKELFENLSDQEKEELKKQQTNNNQQLFNATTKKKKNAPDRHKTKNRKLKHNNHGPKTT